MVSGEEVENVPVPAEVFHNLGGKFHKVPGDVDAVEGFDSDIVGEVVEEVAGMELTGSSIWWEPAVSEW